MLKTRLDWFFPMGMARKNFFAALAGSALIALGLPGVAAAQDYEAEPAMVPAHRAPARIQNDESNAIVQTRSQKDEIQTEEQPANEMFNGFFLGGEAGVDFAGSAPTQTVTRVGSDALATGGLKAGYIWSLPSRFTFRAEADLSWDGTTRYRAANGVFDDNSLLTLFDATVGYYVTPELEPYGGLAVGASTSFIHMPGAGGATSSALAWGPVAGLRYHFATGWQLFWEYKYLMIDGQEYTNLAAGGFSTGQEVDNSVTMGIGTSFKPCLGEKRDSP